MAAPPNGAARPNTEEAARARWSTPTSTGRFHPWAVYAVVGLALAYFVHRKGAPNLISSAFRPLLGDRVDGPIGRGIDGLAIFATLFGSATSLGLGALQINSGMNFLWDVEVSNGFAVAIIAALTAMFVVSAVSGVHRGVQWLSNGNMVLAVLLLTFLFVVGPTVFILDTLAESVGGYVSSVVPRSFQTGAFGDEEWLASWTIFYWAWWISWAPFVGTFIARISRGRTVGEFVLGVLLIPSGVSVVWFAILGGAAIDLQLTNTADISAAVAQAPEIGLFTTLEQYAPVGPHVARRDRARRALLHQRRGRGIARDGHAVVARRPEPAAVGDDLLGRPDRRVGLGAAPGRRARGAPAGVDHRGGAVRAGDDRAVLQPLPRPQERGGEGHARAGRFPHADGHPGAADQRRDHGGRSRAGRSLTADGARRAVVAARRGVRGPRRTGQRVLLAVWPVNHLRCAEDVPGWPRSSRSCRGWFGDQPLTLPARHG